MARRDDDKPRDRDLRRRQMADGGEVVSGSLAREALQAVGARAMTMDRTIFVDDDFDPDNPEDQALYAHERHHQLESGGEHEHGGGHDAEEFAARAIERMVLHRRAAGEDFGSIMTDVRQGRVDVPQEVGGSPENDVNDRGEDPMEAYRRLRSEGHTHDAIVRMLAEYVLAALKEGDEERKLRYGTGPKLT